MSRLLPEFALAFLALAGVALVAVGVALVYLPAGLIVAGLSCLAVAYGLARAVQRIRR